MLIVSLLLSVSAPAFACDKEAATASHTDAAHTEASATGEKKSCPLATAAVTAAVPAQGTHVALNVKGMTCGGCATSVHTALMGVDGVTGASVDFTTGNVQVAYDSSKANPEKLLAAVVALKSFEAKLATN